MYTTNCTQPVVKPCNNFYLFWWRNYDFKGFLKAKAQQETTVTEHQQTSKNGIGQQKAYGRQKEKQEL